MSGIFDFVEDIDNYEERAVKHDDIADVSIDTARVSDGVQPYETGVMSAHYNNGLWVIVEAYDTVPEAILGHDRWLATFSQEYAEFPDQLCDCQNANISGLLESEDLCFSKVKNTT